MAVAVDLSDVVLAHQKMNAADPGLGNFAAARHGTGVVETNVTGDAECGGLVGDDGGYLSVAQQRF